MATPPVSAWRERHHAAGIDAAVWDATWHATGLAGWQEALPTYADGESIATRVAIEKAFNASLDTVPGLVAGAADLTGNTGTKLAGQVPQSVEHPDGRQIYYGIREHGMGSAMVGMALHGGVLPAGGTFFVFLDYMRPAVRLAALAGPRSCSCSPTTRWASARTDPPTSRSSTSPRCGPSPTCRSSARPTRTRPMQAWVAAVEHDGPTALVLSRQNLPVAHRRQRRAHRRRHRPRRRPTRSS